MQLFTELAQYPELLEFINFPASELHTRNFKLEAQYETLSQVPFETTVIEPVLQIIAKLGLPAHFTWLQEKFPPQNPDSYFPMLKALASIKRLNSGHIAIINEILTIEPVRQDLTRAEQELLNTALATRNQRMVQILLQFDHVIEHVNYSVIRYALDTKSADMFKILLEVPQVQALITQDAVNYIIGATIHGNTNTVKLILSLEGVRPFKPGMDDLYEILTIAVENNELAIAQILLNLPEICEYRFDDTLPDETITKLLPLKNSFLLLAQQPAYYPVLRQFITHKISSLRFMESEATAADELDIYFHMLLMSMIHPDLDRSIIKRIIQSSTQLFHLMQFKNNIKGENALLAAALNTDNWTAATFLLDFHHIFHQALTHNFYYNSIGPQSRAKLTPFITQHVRIMGKLREGIHYQINTETLMELLTDVALLNQLLHEDVCHLYINKLKTQIFGMIAVIDGGYARAWKIFQQSLAVEPLRDIANAYILRLLTLFSDYNFLSPMEQHASTFLTAYYAWHCKDQNIFKLSMAKLINPGHIISLEEFSQHETLTQDYQILSFAEIMEVADIALQQFKFFTNQETQLLDNNIVNDTYSSGTVANLFFRSLAFIQILQKKYPNHHKIRILENLLQYPRATSLEDGAIIFNLATLNPAIDNCIPADYQQNCAVLKFNLYLIQQNKIIHQALHNFEIAHSYCITRLRDELNASNIASSLEMMQPITANRPPEHYFAEVSRVLQAAHNLVSGNFANVITEAGTIFTHANCREIASQLITQALAQDNQLIVQLTDTIIAQLTHHKATTGTTEPPRKRRFELHQNVNDDDALDALIATIQAPRANIALQEIINNWRLAYSVSAETYTFINMLMEQYAEIQIVTPATQFAPEL